MSDDLLLRIAEQRLASASAEDYPEAKRRRDAILRNAGDRLYDIKCPQGAKGETKARKSRRSLELPERCVSSDA